MGVIIWSPEAIDDLEGIMDYLVHKWGKSAVIDFGYEVDRVLHIISLRPSLYPLDDTGTLHKAVIVKQVTLLYSVDKDVIELIHFWDNRQNPTKLKL